MYYLSIDDGDLFIGADGNHRTCIARFEFYRKGHDILHGVTVDNYHVDWKTKRLFDEFSEEIERKELPYSIRVEPETTLREDGPGWMIERYRIWIRVVDYRDHRHFCLNVTEFERFVEDVRSGRDRGFLERIRDGFVRFLKS